MTAKGGHAVALKIGDGASPTESFTPVKGIMVTEMLVQNALVESNTLASGAWRALIASAGHRHMQIRAEGVFEDSASEETLRGLAFSGLSRNVELAFPNAHSVRVPMIVAEYIRRGEVDDVERVEMVLESAGLAVYS